MKKIKLAAILLSLSAFAGSVSADIALESKDQVEGTWKLQYSKNTLNDKEPVTRQDTWVFKGGKLTIMHIPRDGKFYDQPPVNYEIEEGKLKIALVGNGKFDVLSLVEKDDKTMTLKGKFGGYFYFAKK